jgi:hypothetical protein
VGQLQQHVVERWVARWIDGHFKERITDICHHFGKIREPHMFRPGKVYENAVRETAFKSALKQQH